MRLSKSAGVGVVALVAAGAVASAAQAATPVPPPSGTTVKRGAAALRASALPAAVAARQAQQGRLMPLATSLARDAKDASSGIAGVSVDAATGTVRVYKTAAGKLPAVARPAGVKLQVLPARFSRAAMLAAGGRITGDARTLGAAHVAVQSVGPAVDGSGLQVSVLVSGQDAGAQLSRAEALLRARYGAVVHTVTATEHRSTASADFFTGWRFNDYAPWYGGDRLSSSVGGCTDGFEAIYNGGPTMLTASHCGGVGTAFSNGPSTTGTFRAIGNSVYSNSGTDVAAIGVTSATNTINVGSTTAPTQMGVSGWASPVVGEYLCQSGSYTGEVCGLRVVDTNQQQCQSWFLWICTSYMGPLSDVINSAGSGSYAAGHGDSGGPVYSRGVSTVLAKGLVHGQLTDNAKNNYPSYYSDQMWCPSPEGWSQRCASGFSFAQMPGY
jgi:hypothetical protein